VEGRLHSLLGRPDLKPVDFFLWRHQEQQIYTFPPRTIEELMARLQAVVTTVDAKILRRVPQNVKHCIVSTFIWTETVSKTYCDYEAPKI
jgi:hypothetical protein